MVMLEAKQQNAFRARIEKIHHGGARSVGQAHAGIDETGKSITFGKARGKARATGMGVVQSSLWAFALGLGGGLGSEIILSKIEASTSSAIAQFLTKLGDLGLTAFVPIGLALLLATAGIVFVGLKGKRVLALMALGCLMFPEVRAIQAKALDFAMISTPLNAWLES